MLFILSCFSEFCFSNVFCSFETRVTIDTQKHTRPQFLMSIFLFANDMQKGANKQNRSYNIPH